jgi:hypothetical protein
VPTVDPGAHTGFGPLKQVKAGVLDIGYAEVGPAHGTARKLRAPRAPAVSAGARGVSSRGG